MRARSSSPHRPPLAPAPARAIDPLERAHSRAERSQRLTMLTGAGAGAGSLLVRTPVEAMDTRAAIDRFRERGYV